MLALSHTPLNGLIARGDAKGCSFLETFAVCGRAVVRAEFRFKSLFSFPDLCSLGLVEAFLLRVVFQSAG